MSDSCGLYTGLDEQVPLKGVKVNAEVVGRGAKVTVSQRFHNNERKPVEAVYKFPLPEHAAVCGFGVVIGGRQMRGLVEERGMAFEMYDEALTNGDLATLLDEERPNIFTLSVGRIDPGIEAVIQIAYVTLLDMDDKVTRFFLPTTISPSYLPEGTPDVDGIPAGETINPPYAVEVPYGLSLSVQIRHGSLIRSVESPSHQIRVERLEGDLLQVTLSQETVQMDRDFILNFEGESALTGRAYRQVKDGDEFLQVDICVPTEEMKAGKGKTESQEIVFVLDCSGSMGGDSIAEVRRGVEICLKAMKEGTLFNVCRFGSRYESLFPAPVLYSAESLGKALEYVRKMDADLGGTEILGPLRDILSQNGRKGDRGRDIVLLTDGEVGNEEEIFKLLKKNGDEARVFPIGIGAGCNEHFIKGLARAGNGSSEFIYPGERIEPKTLRLFGLLGSEPIVEVAVSARGEQSPADPVVFLGRPSTIFVKVKKGELVKGKVTIKGTVHGAKRIWEMGVLDVGEGSLPIPLLLARERIRDLEEGREKKGSRQSGRKKAAVDKEVIALSKLYGILSRSTSYVAVQVVEEKDKFTGEVKIRKVPALITAGWHGRGSVTGRHRAHQTMLSLGPADAAVSFSLADRSARGLPSLKEPAFDKFMDRTSAPPPPPTREDILMAILSCQLARGGFELNQKVTKPLGFSPHDLGSAAKRMTVRVTIHESGGFEDPLLLLSTAVALVILERMFPGELQTWGPVAEKSRNWLFGFIHRYRAKIDDRDIRDWAEGFVQQHVQL